MPIAYGVNPYASGFQLETPPSPECALTIRRTAGGEDSVWLSHDGRTAFDRIWPLDCCGTLCARDGFKTGPRTPNVQDAQDHKLIVQSLHRPCSVRRDSSRRGGIL